MELILDSRTAILHRDRRKVSVRLRLNLERLWAESGTFSKKTVLDTSLVDVIGTQVEKRRLSSTVTVRFKDGTEVLISNLVPKVAERLGSWLEFLGSLESPPGDAISMPYMGGHFSYPVEAQGIQGILFALHDSFSFVALNRAGAVTWSFRIPFSALDRSGMNVRETETQVVSRGGISWTGELVLAQYKQRANEIVIPFHEGARRQEPRFLLPSGDEGMAIVQRIDHIVGEHS